MVELRDCPRFGREGRACRDRSVHHLERDFAPERDLFRETDRPHAAAPENIRQLEVRDFGRRVGTRASSQRMSELPPLRGVDDMISTFLFIAVSFLRSV